MGLLGADVSILWDPVTPGGPRRSEINPQRCSRRLLLISSNLGHFILHEGETAEVSFVHNL